MNLLISVNYINVKWRVKNSRNLNIGFIYMLAALANEELAGLAHTPGGDNTNDAA